MGRRRTTPAATTGLYVGHFTLQPRINYTNNAPVANTWYTVADLSSVDTLRLYSLRWYGLPIPVSTDIQITVDGQVIFSTHGTGGWQWLLGPDGNWIATEPEKYALFDGRAILIEIRGGPGVTNLYLQSWYAERII